MCYLYHSQWQGERCFIKPMDLDGAKGFTEENLEEIDKSRAIELGLIEEGAIE